MRKRLISIVCLLPLSLTLAGGCYRSAAARDQNAASSTVSNDPRDDSNPWGVASGAEWFAAFPAFNPMLQKAGIKWLRGFYEWQTIEPKQGYWNWALTDRLVENARANELHLTFSFAYFAPWASADGGTRKFPIKDMQFWRDYVSSLVARYRNDIKYWEVWNEFNGSFAENGTPEIYAQMVREASISAKKIDPTAKIGMSVANFDVRFLEAAIKAGAADHFDYICIHPYEKLNALKDNSEIDFLNMTTALRAMLAANGQRSTIPLWITEIGAEAPVMADRTGDELQASLLAKAYILSIASGFQRVFWYEARGPSAGNLGDFGLIRADMTPRPSYQALQVMTDLLGTAPTNVGWLNLGDGGYGFVFDADGRNVLAAWAPAGPIKRTVFGGNVTVSDLAGNRTPLPAGQALTLPRKPVLIEHLPAALVAEARANNGKPYPWGGKTAQTQTATVRLQSVNLENGIKQINPDTTSTVITEDDSWRKTDFSRSDGEGHYVYFSVDPQFLPSGTRDLEISAVVRRTEPDKVAGLALNYESEAGYVDGGYFNIPEGDQWHVLRWRVSDANFVGQWGWSFRLNGIASPSDFLIKEVIVKKVGPP
jgi:polysaccharide biosynthesis protein PslG